MKKVFYILAICAAVLATGCSADKEEQTGGVVAEYGDVQITAIASSEVSGQTRATSSTVDLPKTAVPDGSRFALRITGSYNDDMGHPQSYDQSWSTVSAFESPKMRRGEYKATITYGNMESEGISAACFSGEKDFTIYARKTVQAAISASLQNAAIKIAFDEWFNKYYTDAHITIRTESGNKFIFTTGTTNIIFVKPGTKLFMSGTASKSQTGTAVEFPEAEIGSTVARSLHTIALKASEAGSGNLSIDLDDNFTLIEEKIVELNPEV